MHEPKAVFELFFYSRAEYTRLVFSPLINAYPEVECTESEDIVSRIKIVGRLPQIIERATAIVQKSDVISLDNERHEFAQNTSSVERVHWPHRVEIWDEEKRFVLGGRMEDQHIHWITPTFDPLEIAAIKKEQERFTLQMASENCREDWDALLLLEHQLRDLFLLLTNPLYQFDPDFKVICNSGLLVPHEFQKKTQQPSAVASDFSLAAEVSVGL